MASRLTKSSLWRRSSTRALYSVPARNTGKTVARRMLIAATRQVSEFGGHESLQVSVPCTENDEGYVDRDQASIKIPRTRSSVVAKLNDRPAPVCCLDA